MRRFLKHLPLVCLAVSALQATVATAQPTGPLPTRQLTIIVPFPPGGSTDTAVRLIARQLETNTGTSVIVDNKPGANGVIAIQAMKNAAANGSVIFAGHQATHVVNPLIYAKLPYDPVKDFKPITAFMSFPSVLVVPAASPAKTLGQLVALSKDKKASGGLNYSSQGIGTAGHFLGAMLETSTGTPFTHIPHKGAAEAVLEVVSGRVDLVFSSYLTSGAYVRDGRLRMLAVASDKRLGALPDLPTTGELGVPNVTLDYWFGFFAAAATPDPVVDALNRELVKAIHHKAVAEVLQAQAAEVITGTPQQFQALIEKDRAVIGSIVRQTGIKAD